MKTFLLLMAGLLVSLPGQARPTAPVLITSPDGAVRVRVEPGPEGTPRYTVLYRDAVVLPPSRLGLQLAAADLSRLLKLQQVGAVESISDAYSLLNDKRAQCRYQANRRRLVFTGPRGWQLGVVFQVSNDGVAFRYEVTGRAAGPQRVVAEHTTFRLPPGAKGWLHPHAVAQTGWANTQPSYEEYYQLGIAAGTPSPLGQGWSFPALFQTAGHWVLLTETGMDRHYAGTHLRHRAPEGEYGIALPQDPERTTATAALLPEGPLPWRTPWRVVVVGPSLGTIVESTLTTDLATPAQLPAGEFSPPGKAAWSWALLKDESAVFGVQQQFIDYAAAMSWRYCLIDALWDTQIGYEKMTELARYAHTKNVDLLLWYNSNGSWNQAPQTPLRRLFDADTRRQEFARLQQMGIKGVKIDFFGGDGQSFMNYYQDLLEDAGRAGLLVNFHGTTIPRGWTRTYPNLMTMEAVRGYEFITFEQANADQQPTHCAVLPFARNAVGPMDFTPLCFSELPGGIRRATTNGFELALAVLFQSGIQHYVEVPAGMQQQPAYVVDFLRTLPPRWDDVRFLAGFPGQYAVLARKAGSKWYVAGINGTETAQTVTLDLAALGARGGTLITEGSTTRDFSTRHVAGGTVTLPIRAHGGFVLTLD